MQENFKNVQIIVNTLVFKHHWILRFEQLQFLSSQQNDDQIMKNNPNMEEYQHIFTVCTIKSVFLRFCIKINSVVFDWIIRAACLYPSHLSDSLFFLIRDACRKEWLLPPKCISSVAVLPNVRNWTLPLHLINLFGEFSFKVIIEKGFGELLWIHI